MVKVEVDVDKIINDLSKRRIELMKHLCEDMVNQDITIRIVNELRYLTGTINELEKMKKNGKN